MNLDATRWFAGVDWGRRRHEVCLIDSEGEVRATSGFEHGAAGLSAMADWLEAKTQASPCETAVSIEIPHGPVVESLLARGFTVNSINPLQADRFRDRFSPSGAKDDRRDAKVLADALRTDPQAFRRLAPTDPDIAELSELTQARRQLVQDRIRAGLRLQDVLWQYFPALAESCGDVSRAWFLTLLRHASTPSRARRLSKARLATLLRPCRVGAKRIDALFEKLQGPELPIPARTVAAKAAHAEMTGQQLELLTKQIRAVEADMDKALERLDKRQWCETDAPAHSDVAILMSLPGMGKRVLATFFASANELIEARDYRALRSLCGVAPVTKQSGTKRMVHMRRSVDNGLRDSMYNWARVAVQIDAKSKARYSELRSRGKSYGQALRVVGDRLLYVACTILRDGTLFDPEQSSECATTQ